MALVITIKVVPASGKQLWMLDKSGIIKCYLKSPAEQGKANEEVLKLCAQALKVPRDKVSLLMGATSRTKTIKLDASVTYEEFIKAVGIEMQQRLI